MTKLLLHSEIGVFAIGVLERPEEKHGDVPATPATRYAEIGVNGRVFVVVDEPHELRDLARSLWAAANTLEGCDNGVYARLETDKGD